jgi:hypothetical protein
LRAALRLSRDEFEALTLRELTQFAFAKGEEVVMNIAHTADALFTARSAAESEDPQEIFSELWNDLMKRIHDPQPAKKDDYIEHNRRMAQTLMKPD